MLANAIANTMVNALSTSSLAASGAALPSMGGSALPSAPFSGLFNDAVKNVQSLETRASSSVEGLMNGSGVDIHTAMIATEKADTAFELALAVRSKAVGAYQQIMAMQF